MHVYPYRANFLPFCSFCHALRSNTYITTLSLCLFSFSFVYYLLVACHATFCPFETLHHPWFVLFLVLLLYVIFVPLFLIFSFFFIFLFIHSNTTFSLYITIFTISFPQFYFINSSSLPLAPIYFPFEAPKKRKIINASLPPSMEHHTFILLFAQLTIPLYLLGFNPFAYRRTSFC